MDAYGSTFFERFREGSRQSARVVVPLVVDLVAPRSVIDVGCGVATWLGVFRELGVEDVVGVDGDYVDRQALEIPAELFMAADLAQPPAFDRRFDLVVSLEVAEHLGPECADGFVDFLTSLGPVVLFSAAIPGQGGVDHRNEQWPEYWAERFRRRGYVPIDCLRAQIWWRPEVEFWYAQNILIFAAEAFLPLHERLSAAHEATRQSQQLAVVHPECYREVLRKQTEHAVSVSVVISCDARGGSPRGAIESALSQSYPRVEVVVIDDGRRDETRALVGHYPRVRYVAQEPQGRAAARNTGIRESTGDFLVFLDGDDRLLPHAVARTVECLNAHPGSAFVAGRMHAIAAEREPWRCDSASEDVPALLLTRYEAMYPLAAGYRRSAIEAAGGFDTSLGLLADWDLDLRLARRGNCHLYDEIFGEYRHTHRDLRPNARAMMTCYLTIARRHGPRVERLPRYAATYRDVMRVRHAALREPLLDELRTHFRWGHWSEIPHDVACLLRYYERQFRPVRALRWLRRVAMGVRRTVEDRI